MRGIRLRTKFLLSLLAVSTTFICATLLIVRRTVQGQVRNEILGDLRNSVNTFESFERQRKATLARSAELLANLPILKAVMTTHDAATIQDSSADLWRLAGSDLFVLADRSGKIVAYHSSGAGLSRAAAQDCLERSTNSDRSTDWWFGSGHLYEVFIQPVYFGAAAQDTPLGVVALGHEIDIREAKDVARIAASQVAFYYGDRLVVSTLAPSQQAELSRQLQRSPDRPASQTEDIQLDDERYLMTSIELAPEPATGVSLLVLKSFDQATLFLNTLDRSLFVLGLVAVLVGTISVFLISDTFTRPLANLVGGVRALGQGDFTYPLEARGRDEVAEVTSAFDTMRTTLRKAQQQLVDSERLATIGRMASSISHDLRHPMTAIMANAEFLSESHLDARQREELYQEVRIAVDQMTDLVDSLLEFSRARSQMRLLYSSIRKTVQRAIHTVRARAEFNCVNIAVSCDGRDEAWFDPQKLERVFRNLLLNACEAISPASGNVEVNIRGNDDNLEIRVSDDGPGIPEKIREKLFQPFVSYGKQNGTGLGLTIVQKIVQDHGGDVWIESCATGRTVFKVVLPIQGSVDAVYENEVHHPL
ncbi:MAG TPA: HAMP domain-containing sensor histidine kinase [Candidatus Acidoferrales bacterium]|nr:HAMP domain-containing sensor histidine kinase [Candidatus Acidoferrales bacterium]